MINLIDIYSKIRHIFKNLLSKTFVLSISSNEFIETKLFLEEAGFHVDAIDIIDNAVADTWTIRCSLDNRLVVLEIDEEWDVGSITCSDIKLINDIRDHLQLKFNKDFEIKN